MSATAHLGSDPHLGSARQGEASPQGREAWHRGGGWAPPLSACGQTTIHRAGQSDSGARLGGAPEPRYGLDRDIAIGVRLRHPGDQSPPARGRDPAWPGRSLRLRAPGARSPRRSSCRTARSAPPPRPARSRPPRRDAGPLTAGSASIASARGSRPRGRSGCTRRPGACRPAGRGRPDRRAGGAASRRRRPCRRRRPSRPGRRPGRRSRRARATDRGAARTPRRSARRAPRSPCRSRTRARTARRGAGQPSRTRPEAAARSTSAAPSPSSGEQLLDRRHGCEHTCLGLERQALEKRRGLLRRAPVELRVGVMPGGCE